VQITPSSGKLYLSLVRLMTFMHYAMRLAHVYVMYFMLLKIVSHFKYTSHAVHMDVNSSDLLEQAFGPG